MLFRSAGANHHDPTELSRRKVGRTHGIAKHRGSLCSDERIHCSKGSLNLLQFGSTVLAINGFTWVVSHASLTLIMAKGRSWYGERLVGSSVKIEFVSAFAAEP